MEDLASVVMDQLKLEDGPMPFVLVYTRYGSLGDRYLAINAERVNGTLVYKVNVASGEWNNKDEHGAPIWSTVTYADEKATAAFATAYLRQAEGARLSLHELNIDKWRALRSAWSWHECLSREFGAYTVTTENDILIALRVLTPLSMIVGEKRVC